MAHKLRFILRRRAAAHGSGQAIVEFAMAGTVFFMLVFGTLDFGRAIFMYSELHNAVREGARVAKITPTATTAIRTRVIDQGPGLDLVPGNITVSCSGACEPGNGAATVAATVSFQAITQELLGIAPFNLTARATVEIE